MLDVRPPIAVVGDRLDHRRGMEQRVAHVTVEVARYHSAYCPTGAHAGTDAVDACTSRPNRRWSHHRASSWSRRPHFGSILAVVVTAAESWHTRSRDRPAPTSTSSSMAKQICVRRRRRPGRQARAAAGTVARAGIGRRRVQRWCRFGIAGGDRPRRARCRRFARGDGGVAVARRGGTRRLRGACRRMATQVDAGRHARDGTRRVPDQRWRSLLPLQGGADGRARHRSPAPTTPRSCSASTSTTSVTTARASGRRSPRGARLSACRGRVHQARRPRVITAARLAHLGQARGGVSGEPRAVRHRGVGADPRPWSSGPRRRCARWASASAGCATTTTPPASRSTSAELRPVDCGRGRTSSMPCAAAGYRYVTLDLEGFRSGNLNAALA